MGTPPSSPTEEAHGFRGPAPQASESAPLRRQSSYFGSFSALSGFTDDQLEDQIGHLQRTRLRQASERRLSASCSTLSLGISPPSPLAVRTAQLRAFVSVHSPAPYMRLSEGAYALVFGLRTELPGQMTLVADGQIAAAAFRAGAAEARGLPLPALADFTVEFAPLMDGAPALTPAGYAAVEAQSYRFRVVDASTDLPQFVLAEQQLRTAAKVYRSEQARYLSVRDGRAGACLFCLHAQADGPPCACGRALCCAACRDAGGARCARCPFCAADLTR
jgi:hypothetical protein